MLISLNFQGMTLFGVEPTAENAQQTMKLARLAEQYGYDFVWTPDSQLIWRELYSYMVLSALNTSRVKVGSGVTNLSTRHPTVVASAMCTVNEISNGRAVLGLGRGDSALRIMSDKPMPMSEFMEKSQMVKALCNGSEVEYNHKRIRVTWANGRIPVYIAAYGPKMLEFAGRVADGVILQIGEPNVIKWMIGYIRKGAEESGRGLEDLDIVAFTACYVSDDLDKARNIIRWYPATVSNHVFSLLSQYSISDLPPELVMDMENIKGKYNYLEHDVVDAQHSRYVSDRLVDSFTIVGSPEKCTNKIRELENAGITNVNLYLPTGESEHVLKTFGEQVMPNFK